MRSFKNILVIPNAGFGNRLRVLASAYIYSKLHSIPLYVNWEPEECCNIRIHEIFKTEFKGISTADLKTASYIFNPKVHTTQILVSSVQKTEDESIDFLIVQGGHESKDPAMSVARYLYEKNQFYSKVLQFTDEISTHVKEYAKKFDIKNRISIHMRMYIDKYDNADKYTFENDVVWSSVDRYVGNVLKFDPNKKFFLSCNDSETIKKMLTKYGESICVNSFKLPSSYDTTVIEQLFDRNNRDAIIRSVSDMLLMSNSEFIIGTFRSSFSDEACFFNMIPKVCLSGTEHHDTYHCLGYDVVLGINMVLPDYSIAVLVSDH